MIVLFDTYLFNWEFLHLRHTEPNGFKVRFLFQAPPGGEYPDGEFPGDIDPGKLNRWFPFIPGPLGILGWNLRRFGSVHFSRGEWNASFFSHGFFFPTQKCLFVLLLFFFFEK